MSISKDVFISRVSDIIDDVDFEKETVNSFIGRTFLDGVANLKVSVDTIETAAKLAEVEEVRRWAESCSDAVREMIAAFNAISIVPFSCVDLEDIECAGGMH